MPLKHRTETRLIIVLALVMALTGFLMAVLPPVPTGLIPWGVLLLLALAYPLALYPLFRRDRADYMFRLLHWVPAAMLLLWLAFQLLVGFAPSTAPVLRWFTWGFGFVPVALGMLALVNFCLDVIRQRVPRVPALLLIWVLFAFSALRADGAGLATQRWLASTFEREPSLVAQESSSSAMSSLSAKSSVISKAPSSRSQSSLSQASVLSSAASESSADGLSFWERIVGSNDEGDDAASAGSARSAVSLRSVSSSPSELPSSGFGWGAIALSVCALYCGTLHRRWHQEARG